MNFDLSLYLVTDRRFLKNGSLFEVVVEAVKGGVTMVQLREKNCSGRDFYTIAMDLKECIKPYNVPLIINDRLDIALACDAEGLHLGQDDIPYEIARQIMGKDKIIGLSVENLDDVYEANKLDVDYIGISPIFNTNTKTDTARAFGIDGLKKSVEISRHPIIAIGGINNSNIKEIIKTGTNGVALVSAIMGADNPQNAASELYELIKSENEEIL